MEDQEDLYSEKYIGSRKNYENRRGKRNGTEEFSYLKDDFPELPNEGSGKKQGMRDPKERLQAEFDQKNEGILYGRADVDKQGMRYMPNDAFAYIPKQTNLRDSNGGVSETEKPIKVWISNRKILL